MSWARSSSLSYRCALLRRRCTSSTTYWIAIPTTNTPSKSQRPIASGELPVRTALIAAAVLAVGGLAVAGLLASTDLMWLVAGYLGLQAIYVAWAKHQPVLDLASVAAGFVIRAIAGGVAVGFPTSTWFMTVTAATAFFVVSGKRYSELVTQGVSGTRQGLKDYSEGYLRFAWGVSVGIAVVFYGLWAAELSSGDSGFWGRVRGPLRAHSSALRPGHRCRTGRGAGGDALQGTGSCRSSGSSGCDVRIAGLRLTPPHASRSRTGCASSVRSVVPTAQLPSSRQTSSRSASTVTVPPAPRPQ